MEKGGVSHQLFLPIHLPHEDTTARELERLVSGHSVFTLRHKEQKAAGSPGQGAPSCCDKAEGHPPPPQLLGREAGLRLLAPTHVPEKGSFLAPGLFSLPGGSSGDRAGKKAAKGDRETWKQGPRGCLIVLFSPRQGNPSPERGPQPPCSVDMKRMLSRSCSW